MAREVLFTFDPFEIAGVEEIPKNKSAILDECKDFAIDEIKKYCERSQSPVEGHGKFKALTRKYREIKKSKGGSGNPDLFLSGDMLDALKGKKSGTEIALGIVGKQGDKADGHCNFSGESELPLRRFIPFEGDGETFKKPIIDGIKRIVREGVE